MSWRWISIAALLATVVIGFRLLSKGDGATDTSGAIPQLPTYYLKDAILTETQPDGSPSVRLIATRIEQSPSSGRIELISVRVDYLKVPGRQWLLSAQRGLIPSESRTIQFLGDVELRPADGPASTYLRTDELTVDTERNVAYTTTSPVNMHFGMYAMTVKRFEADLNTEKVRMEDVHGRSGAG
jgi:LPS export ABC transporter protein LptC